MKSNKNGFISIEAILVSILLLTLSVYAYKIYEKDMTSVLTPALAHDTSAQGFDQTINERSRLE